ncbi:hypothetical protein [Streptomyces sp. NRRL F-5755]|uniref:hypothetical protein n=1 Tax=Streptomyces sp. NRRL F-5755 TaxID=1519475 RepID=UPI0006B0000A|nr:hypothetical protein [Streptomyces sp. NRRL F-5755]
MQSHGYVFFGDIEVRCYKHKARRVYNERDIRRLGRALAELRLDLDVVVDAKLPTYRDDGHRESEDRYPGWRQRLVSWMFTSAH